MAYAVYIEKHGQEAEVHFGRYLGKMQWWFPFIDFDWRTRTDELHPVDDNLFQQNNTKNNRTALGIGIQYTLPMLLKLDLRVDTDGRIRSQLMREDIPVTPRLRLDAMGNSDLEYMGRLRYVLDKTWALSAHYDSDMGPGLGITVSY